MLVQNPAYKCWHQVYLQELNHAIGSLPGSVVRECVAPHTLEMVLGDKKQTTLSIGAITRGNFQGILLSKKDFKRLHTIVPLI